jgi:hypothetical protein
MKVKAQINKRKRRKIRKKLKEIMMIKIIKTIMISNKINLRTLKRSNMMSRVIMKVIRNKIRRT